MSLEDLDLLDRKILSELDRDARISYSALGKKLRTAKETVKYRIQQLEKRGIIKGYYTVLNLSKLGQTLHRVYLRLQNTNPKTEADIILYLSKSKNVSVIYHINGSFHLALGVWASDIWEYETFWQEFKEQFGEHISDCHASIISEYLEFSRSYLSPIKNTEKEIFSTVIKNKEEELDNTDVKLLSFISNNARASLVEIAEKLSISVVTARYHLKNLIKRKIIVGFRSIINLNSLGMEYYKVDLWLTKFDKTKEIIQHIVSHQNVTYTETTLVTSDFEFDIEVESFDKFISIMDFFRVKFPDDIKDYKYYSLVKNYKTSYVPTL
ncbi:MAG: Lrp/AsnC family transcriptional regulator [Candidatus Micrarchaeota archaeon]|nr:Lrp/AsnC family transcriptional regulator [Candidatus Micrarchaeota archaeon]